MRVALLIFVIVCSPIGYANESPIEPLKFTGFEFNTNNSFQFKSFKGKIIYIDFWASWCAPCLESIPFMEKLYNQRSHQGFEIIAINIDDNKVDADSFLLKNSISYINLYDPRGLIGKKFKVKNIPTAFLIDKEGKILFKHEGFNKEYAKKLELAVLEQINK